MPHSPDEYLTTSEAEQYSGLRNLRRRRVLGAEASPPFIKAGIGKNGRVLYSRNAIDQWMQERTRRSTSEHTVAMAAAVAAIP